MTPWQYVDGALALSGELYEPDAPNGRAVLVVHEADGIGGNVRRHCAALAERGYLAAAADMHGGGRVLEGTEMADALARFRSDPDLLRGRAAAALAALRAHSGLPPERLAAIGFCFGGFAALELARSGAALGAVASFHGLLTTDRPAPRGTIRPAILACTGTRDPLVPPEDVAAFRREMIDADADWHLVEHGRALHSFTNPDVDRLGDPRMGYDPAAAAMSRAALIAFLEAALG
jgi:dienelactone hydrolase